jgi:enoyl-CoA hydratase
MSGKMEKCETESLRVDLKDRCAVIRFVRPELRNPLSVATLELLSETFSKLESNNKIRTIIFTGSEKIFAAGADLSEVAALSEETAEAFGRRGQTLMRKIFLSKKITVAAIEGFCLGGALDLALSCKLRIAAPDSVFAHPGAGLGIITGWGGTQMLPRLIGRKKALEMFVTARRIDAFEAKQIGLIDEIAENPLVAALEMRSK